MSNPVRPSLVGPQPTMSGRMMSPVCATGAPAMIPVVPNAYGLIGPQPNSYMQRSNFPQQNIPNRMPLVNAIPGHLPGMYVPVVPMNAGLNHSNMDPAKLLEEQKRLERERNFQMQQQRLKQFTVAGKKGSLNADSLIDSIIGKVQPKTNHTTSSSFAKPSVPTEPVKPIQPRREFPPSVTVFKQETPPPNIPVNPQKPKKELDAMMRECSDLSGPQKANKFSKPVVKELGPSTQQRYTFTASNKSRDWKTIQGLDEVFVTKKSRFPQWCSKEYIPDLYKSVETIVTNNGTTTPDTKLLFPILISSGLPQQILGQIWELVNQSAPGQLTLEETYAALALIAVAQAGHPLKTADVLHQLPACPIPQLQCFAVPSQSIPTETNIPPPSSSSTIDKSKPATYSASESPDQNTHLVIRPSAISLKEVTNSANIPNASSEIKKEIAAGSASAGLSGFTSSPDDEFDDFKSATPTAVNFAITTPSSDSLQEDDAFADFKQAPPPVNSSPIFKKVSIPSAVNKPPLVEQDLMSPEEDKYSIFRTLQQVENTDDWGDFSSVATDLMSNVDTKLSDTEEFSQKSETISSELQANPSVFVESNDSNLDLFKMENPAPIDTTKDDDDFGDFLHAEPPLPTVDAVTSQLKDLNTNFANFDNFKEPITSIEFHQMQLTGPSNNSQLDDEFGDFASSLPIPCKPELGSEFLFRHLKDNISLAESQSVSSLELGTFDGGGHSGESKSSLSRQGSIPSLDLKNTFVEGGEGEDYFGEFQSPVPPVSTSSKSPSPAKDVKGPENNGLCNNLLNVNFQNVRSVAPLTDKYSVIRAEERKDEDQHISCWVRCLQSSLNILQNTKKIFNQMSCSSVCNEVLRSEEGENYIKDFIEVYKVVRRIAVASKSANKQTVPIIDLLKEIDQVWHTICGFFAGSALMPKESSLEFSSAILDDNTKACGLCLLDIETKNKFASHGEVLKLSYGGRNYHSTCANLWVNCVDPLLPALPLPQLL